MSAEDLELTVDGDKITVKEWNEVFSFKELEKEIKEKQQELEVELEKDKKRIVKRKEEMKKKYNEYIEKIENLKKIGYKYFVVTTGKDWKDNVMQDVFLLQNIIDKELKERWCNRNTIFLLENINTLSKGKEITIYKRKYKLGK